MENFGSLANWVLFALAVVLLIFDLDTYRKMQKLRRERDEALLLVQQLTSELDAGRERRRVPSHRPSTPAEPLSEFREGQWWIKELDEMANNPIGEEIFVTADLKRAVATVHHLLRAVRESESQKNAN